LQIYQIVFMVGAGAGYPATSFFERSEYSAHALTKQNHPTHEPGDLSPTSLADDLLWGAAAIADELGLNRRKVFYYLERGTLPARKVGELWVASRRQLRAHLLGEAA